MRQSGQLNEKKFKIIYSQPKSDISIFLFLASNRNL